MQEIAKQQADPYQTDLFMHRDIAKISWVEIKKNFEKRVKILNKIKQNYKNPEEVTQFFKNLYEGNIDLNNISKKDL